MKEKPVLRWPGGKTRRLPDILPLIRPHDCYVEAFAGGLAVFLARPPSKVEVVNDLNGDLVALYRCAQFHLDALLTELQWMLSSRENLMAYQRQPGLTDLQRAARFLTCNATSFGGGGTSYAVSKQCRQKSRERLMETLTRLSTRLDGVAVENASYERILTNYDSPKTLFFLDPPYMGQEVSAYAAWSEAQMTEFAARVESLAGDWIVTVNDSPLTRSLFARHEVKPVVTISGAVNRATDAGATFGELVIRRKYRREVAAAKRVPRSILKPLLKAA